MESKQYAQVVSTVAAPVSRRSALRARAARRLPGAFTLIELLLVLVILGVLAALVVPRLAGIGERSRKTAAAADVSTIKGALGSFEVYAGRFPTSDEGLDALVNKPADVKEWNGPYLEKLPIDPWGHQYVYHFPGTHNPNGFDVYSLGPDGQDGTADDIGNW